MCHLLVFFFNDTATTEIYTLSLHDALPIWTISRCAAATATPPCWSTWPPAGRSTCHQPLVVKAQQRAAGDGEWLVIRVGQDRKSTRLNSSHANISYAVFCLKKKKKLKHTKL